MNFYDPRYMSLQQDKLQAIVDKEATATAVASDLNVSRQTIHKWLSRYRRFGIDGFIIHRKKNHPKAHNRISEEVETLVGTLADEHWEDGVEALHDRLQGEYNTTLHPTTMYRILKRNNVRYTTNYPHTKKQWKKQLFSHQVAGQELQMDTKYPYGYKQGKVMYTIIDDATRWVCVWSYETDNAHNTVDFLEKVLKRAPFTIQKIRTDQGTEFVNRIVTGFLEEHAIPHRKNTPYCPEENGKIERFHRTLNDKCIRFGLYPQDSLETMQYKLNLFLHYYNFKKRHRGLGMDGMTPMEKMAECASVNLTLQCYNY